MHSPRVSISIASRDQWDLLKRCLRSIYETAGAMPIEVIVVDDVSSHGYEERIRSSYPDVHVISNEQHCSFAQSHNKALARASAPYFVVANDDVEVHDGTLETIADYFDCHPDVGAIGVREHGPDGRVREGSIGPRKTFWTLVRDNLLELYFLRHLGPWRRYYDFERTHEVHVTTGAFMVVRKAAVEEVGPLDENFPLYFEDVDWLMRIEDAGWKILYLPEASIMHHGGATTSLAKERSRKLQYRSAQYFFRKRGRGYLGSLLAASYATSCGLRALLFTLKAMLRRADRVARQNARTYWRLLWWHLRGAPQNEEGRG